MSINFKEVYGDRISEINKQTRTAINNKKWTEAAKLKAEKADLEKRISQMR